MKNLILETLSLLAILLASAASHAAGPEECAGSASQMSECLRIELTMADQDLRILLQRNLANPQIGVRLVNSHKAWLEFRDADCTLQSADFIGSIEDVAKSQCMLDMTRDRIARLKTM